jgi:hypothetical protein
MSDQAKRTDKAKRTGFLSPFANEKPRATEDRLDALVIEVCSLRAGLESLRGEVERLRAEDRGGPVGLVFDPYTGWRDVDEEEDEARRQRDLEERNRHQAEIREANASQDMTGWSLSPPEVIQ